MPGSTVTDTLPGVLFGSLDFRHNARSGKSNHGDAYGHHEGRRGVATATARAASGKQTKAALPRCDARLTQFKLSVRGSSDGLRG